MRNFFCAFLILPAFGCASGQNIDIRVLRSVYNNESVFKNKFFKLDAQGVVVFNLAVPAGIFASGLINRDQLSQRDGLFVAGAFVLSAAATQSLKAIIKRARPFETYPQYFADRYDGGGYSFPSGHVSAAFCTATSLSIYFPKWYVITPAYLWAASVGWARMYQGVHYPSDVLAGAVVGAGSAWAGQMIQKYVDKKHLHKQPLPVIQ
jgi:membrane-associated phospholipid phosphatase